MRTVDPQLWSTKIKKTSIEVKFGQNVSYDIETCLRLSLCDAMKEFWTNCSVVAIKHMNMGFDSKFEKYQSIFMILLILSGSVFVVTVNYHRFHATPKLLESLISDQYSIRDIDFPAIALCSTNVINKTTLNKYVQFLNSKDRNSSYSSEDIQRNLLNFGTLLTMGAPPAPVDVMFLQFLERLVADFNVTDIIYRLSPQCASLLLRCSWAGQITPCEELFATRITGLGFCCVFNSRYQREDWHTAPKVLNVIGQDNGLSVVFKENSDEFAFVRSAIAGVQVLIFDGIEYPILEGGAVRMYPLRQNTSGYISLRVRAQQPSDSLLNFNEDWDVGFLSRDKMKPWGSARNLKAHRLGFNTILEKRGCRLRDVEPPRWWRTSYSWCLSLCRARTANALCDCRPHSLPHKHTSSPDDIAVCSPNHLACLNKYREKLVYYYPGEVEEEVEASLDEELQNAQVCLHCAPDCARLRYTADLSYSTHSAHLHGRTLQNFFLKGLSITNATVVQIFYPIEDQSLYAVETYLRWYEAVSIISVQWVCVVGVSCISAAELVFHLVFRWPLHLVRRRRGRAGTVGVARAPTTSDIYISN